MAEVEQNDGLIVNANGVEIFDNDIELAIDEACAKFKIDDLVKEGQSRWKAVMHYVGKRVFPDRKVLKDRRTIRLDGNRIPTNNNRYDYDILNILCDYYINLSRSYDKLVSIVAFSEMVNIDVGVLNDWQHSDPSSMSWNIWKKLQGNREDSLKDKAIDSHNVMGVFQVGRREFYWDMPGVRQEQTEKRALSLKEIPKNMFLPKNVEEETDG